ncbi:LysR family transcriptional regulator [Horticoccus luteus]|uniref:LysR family transcriptional regulator n=1 Tax=Horticoccus luteus TaxID=2862869 RepID=A0A8F9XLV8_9BACT|nr:LysR family transcriptional regulator [Horticoccus luteus]QYM79419.1 LysR family transcriptional regulator [Horticoccus luteus]
MELTQLRYLLAVAESGNFTRAAAQSNVSQPALSQQIINLEAEIGRKLFHRLGRRAVLTEAGENLVERARRILFEVENAAKELQDSPTASGRIVVGAVQTVMPYLVTPLIAQLRTSHPHLTVDAREDFRHDLVASVLEGDVDFAVVPLPLDNRRVSIEPLFTDPLLLVVGHSHPIAQRAEININDLAGENFVTLGQGSTLAAQIRAFFGDHNFEPRIRYRCAQVATLKMFVSLGLGISILPQLARQPRDQETLTYLRLTGIEPTRELAVVRHLQRYQTRGAEQFLKALREAVRPPAPPVAS